MENCTVCDGELILLGRMGGRNHYRCRACGMTHSEQVTPIKKEDAACNSNSMRSEEPSEMNS
jgi:hypothetical protein